MGRPLNKRNFLAADGTPSSTENELKVDFNDGSAKIGYIVKQKGSKRFVCSPIGASANTTKLCTLVTGKLIGALAEGECMITVKAADNETYNVSKISGRVMTLVTSAGGTANENEFNGAKVSWNFTGASGLVTDTVRSVIVEEAGDDDTIGDTDDTPFTEDT